MVSSGKGLQKRRWREVAKREDATVTLIRRMTGGGKGRRRGKAPCRDVL